MTGNGKKFSVVQFLALPFEGIDDYVCVPDSWVVIRRKNDQKDQKVVVAYPKDEDRFVTRDRVEREERYIEDWQFWMAEEKYQSDSFDDADFWIATRNDYGPLVSQNSSPNETPSTSTLKKKLRSSKQRSTSKYKKDTVEVTKMPYKISRKSLTTIKRTASDESLSQLETKRGKQSTTKAAEPSGAVSQDDTEEPGFSSMPAIIEDEPELIDIVKDKHSQQDHQSSKNNDNSKKRVVIDTTHLRDYFQDNGNSSWNFQPQIASVQSLATTSNKPEPRADDSPNNGRSTSQQEPESIATLLYEKMKGKPSLVAKHPAVEKKIHVENISRRLASLLEDPPNSMNQNQPRREPRTLPTSRTSVVSAPQNLPSSLQQRPNFARLLVGPQNWLPLNQHMQQTTRGQNLPQRSTEAHRRDPRLGSGYRPISEAINIEHPTIGRRLPVFDPTIRDAWSPSTPTTPEQMQSIFNRQVTHLPTWDYRKRPIATATVPRTRGSTPFPEEARRNTTPSLFSNLPDSIQRELLTTRSEFLSHQEESEGFLAQGTPIIETHPDALNSAAPVYGIVYQNSRTQSQTVDHFNDRSQVYLQNEIYRSPSASDSGVDIDHDSIFYHAIPAKEAFIATTDNVNPSQDNSRFISQQQMKDQFSSVSAQMRSTLDCMVNVFENLRTSIRETAASYQTLLDNMERFNSPENSPSQASMSRNVAQEVQQVNGVIESAATKGANFNGDQNRNDVVNEAPETNPNSIEQLFNLPPEYDPNDTRWTLKHHEHKPGLVELMPHSNIYVDYGQLHYIENTTSNCTTLARRILLEVFSREAVSVCSSMTEKGPEYCVYPHERPKLNEHGCLVLLNYILEHGLKRGWQTDMQHILIGLHEKVKEIRCRFGVMSRC